MSSPKQADHPHDVLVVAPGVARMAPTEEELSRLARSLRAPTSVPDKAPEPAAADLVAPTFDTTFRPAAIGNGVSAVPARRSGARAIRSFIVAVIVATVTAAAGYAWHARDGDMDALIAQWVPSFAQSSFAALKGFATRAPSSQPASAAEAAPTDTAQADAAPGNTPPATAVAEAASPAIQPPPVAADNDIAGMRDEIAQLKASIEDLKASQQQMARDLARAVEAKAADVAPVPRAAPVARARTPGAAPAAAAQPRRPVPPRPSQRAATAPPPLAAYPPPPPPAPYVPRQSAPVAQTASEPISDPDLGTVPRPPMPLR